MYTFERPTHDRPETRAHQGVDCRLGGGGAGDRTRRSSCASGPALNGGRAPEDAGAVAAPRGSRSGTRCLEGRHSTTPIPLGDQTQEAWCRMTRLMLKLGGRPRPPEAEKAKRQPSPERIERLRARSNALFKKLFVAQEEAESLALSEGAHALRRLRVRRGGLHGGGALHAMCVPGGVGSGGIVGRVRGWGYGGDTDTSSAPSRPYTTR